MISIRLLSGWGKKVAARISKEGAMHVVMHPHPPDEGDLNYPIPFNLLFTNNGSSDMKVVGTLANPIDFSVNARTDFDIFIKTITIRISAANIELNKFGGITGGLANGIDLIHQSSRIGENYILQDAKTNLDIFRIDTDGKGFGQTSNAWKADVSGAGAQTYLPDIDFAKRNGSEYGIKLQAGTLDKLILRIKDDVTSVDVLNAEVHGIILL